MAEAAALPVALTEGEPAGIGPELAAKAWAALGSSLPFFWIGDPRHLPQGCRVVEITRPSEAAAAAGSGLPVLVHEFPAPAIPGRPAPENAAHVIAVIREAVELVQAGEAAAVTTLPISKAALIAGAGFSHPGHTEFLAALAGVERVAMMLASRLLRVVPATIHIPLRAVAEALTPELLEGVLRLTHAALISDFGIARPRLAVAGLNPHAGEGGAMGDEETRVIGPVIERLRGEGLEIHGPLPADTMFHDRARAGYDAAVAMYHDQALIPIKTLDFAGGVNVTLGLPFVRTSPDHGTAFDISGQGVADVTSTLNALKLAAEMAARRRAAAR